MTSQVQGPLSLDQNNNSNGLSSKKGGKNYEKYSLRPRSIQKRIETEKRAAEPKKTPKPKHKPPPLSKYRRKTANARERTRMKEINEAFDALQTVVPQYPILPVNAQGKTCEKLTKITTLRLAMKYIASLNQMLKGPSLDGPSSSSSFSNSGFGLLEDDPFSTLSPSGSSGSDFSPASSSSSTFSLSPCPPIPASSTPDCIQTVMRSVVQTPSAQNRNSARNSSSGLYSTSLLTSPSPSYLPSLSSTLLMSSGSSFPQKVSSYVSCSAPKLPTTNPLKFHQFPLVSSLLSECGGNRTGSLSSLTESDLSEYASDLLSDEGSTLDDPMFDDLIGVVGSVGGTVDDLDHLILESDGDSLHFSSDLSDS